LEVPLVHGTGITRPLWSENQHQKQAMATARGTPNSAAIAISSTSVSGNKPVLELLGMPGTTGATIFGIRHSDKNSDKNSRHELFLSDLLS